MTEEELLAALDEDSKRKREGVRQMLIKDGRQDLLGEFDAKCRELDLGITAAQGTWHALSGAQRRALELAKVHRGLHGQSPYDHFVYQGADGVDLDRGIGRRTIENLMGRDLLAWDPESGGTVIYLTERGYFILKHGPTEKMW